ncbi:hypothetical protein OSB04_019970 [Centaurea solstitialis]|uniref:Integrase zinc-binding domain-containing protein n=1 Tax=Centaurea solstitialis TaxID=347529 RepID=A0AA38W5H0_9ASTR|nr:hypothetical protein OSB04_019970 [Centaurea solstitialis]
MVGYDQYLTEDNRGLKVFRDRVWIPKLGGIQDIVLSKAPKSRMSVHPGRTKVYYDLKSEYWWLGMKRDIARFVEQCVTCSQVKAEHKKPYGNLQPLNIYDVEMGGTYNGFGNKASEDELSTRQHLSCCGSFNESRFGIGEMEASSRSEFDMGKQRSNACQISGVIQEMKIPRTESSKGGDLKFNVKSEHMVGYDQYLTEDNRGLKVFRDRVWIPKLGGIQDIVLSKAPKSRMSVHPGRTKVYYDLKSEYWWLGMKRDIARFVEQCVTCSQVKAEHKKPYGKLSPRFVGPFKITERIGKQAYRLELPEELSSIHDVFHVGYLRKCLGKYDETVLLTEVKIDERLRYIEKPEEILNERTTNL